MFSIIGCIFLLNLSNNTTGAQPTRFEGLIKTVKEENLTRRRGFVVEVGLPSNSIRGDFDGKTFLADAEEVIVLPEFDPGLGWSVGVGKCGLLGTVLFSYAQSSHDVTFQGAAGDAVYHELGLMARRAFMVHSRVQPDVESGAYYHWIVVRDGGATAEEKVGDARFTGVGFQLGIGATFHVTDRFYVAGGPVFRGQLLGWVKGPSGHTKEITSMMLNKYQRMLSGGLWVGGLGLRVSAGVAF
jgi:hypothetical protein